MQPSSFGKPFHLRSYIRELKDWKAFSTSEFLGQRRGVRGVFLKPTAKQGANETESKNILRTN